MQVSPPEAPSSTRPGAKIAVLEAGRIAEGASGRNSGFMIDLPHELGSAKDYEGQGSLKNRTMIYLNRQAIAFARASVEEYASTIFFDPAGKVNGAARPKQTTTIAVMPGISALSAKPAKSGCQGDV